MNVVVVVVVVVDDDGGGGFGICPPSDARNPGKAVAADPAACAGVHGRINSS